MSDQGLIIVTHSMFPPRIVEADVLEALPPEQRSWPRIHVEIQPDYRGLGEYDHGYPWETIARRQADQFYSRLEPVLEDHPRWIVCYFGLAPVPLAFHLGALLPEGYRLQIFQRHHRDMHWSWLSSDADARPDLFVVPTDPGEYKSFTGDLVLRVSTSHRIEAADTDAVFRGRVDTKDFDLRIREPDEDCFCAAAELEAFCEAFDELADRLRNNYPATARLHLFAAVPCGVAFRLGTYFNPNVRHPTQTYKFKPDRPQRYEPAVAIGYAHPRARMLLLTADARGWLPTAGVQEIKQIRDRARPHRTRVEVEDEVGIVAKDLAALLDRDATILHFAGHGTGPSGEGGGREIACPEIEEPGQLVMINSEGGRVCVDHETLLALIGAGKPHGLRCLVVSACFGDELARRVVHEAGVDYALGFRGAIDDRSALEFSLAFYSSLLSGEGFDQAVVRGQQTLLDAALPGSDQVRSYCRRDRDLTPLLPRWS